MPISRSPQRPAALAHRADIEGLRGVAVLSVLAVHAWPDLLRGGFVGVDIFFVLSGFLITTLMLDSMASVRFSLAAFYQRRALRLLPALCTVLLCCLVAAAFTFPSETKQIGRHVAASALFASNIALWQEAGYFDASSDTKPLLHLWSLGIEEQFYLLWPLVTLALFRWRRHAFKIVAALLLGSFLLNVIWVVAKAKGTFFLLPTRAWELMAGAALATLLSQGPGWPRWPALAQRLATSGLGPWLPSVMAWTGAALIALAFALLDSHAAFPGWWALLPTTGTVLLLAAGPAAWFNQRVLAQPVLVFYGSISYPLYLWHWPLLVFPVLLGLEMDNALRVVVLTASVGLAALTVEYIERPIRFGSRSPRTAWALGGGLAALGLAGLVLNLSDGLVGHYPYSVREIARADFAFDYSGYRSHRCFLDLEEGAAQFTDECWPAAQPKSGTTLLWGDSHAAALYPGMQAAASSDRPGHFLAQFTKARCPPVAQAPDSASRQCQTMNDHVLQALALRVPDRVVLAGNWSTYADGGPMQAKLLSDLRETVRRLTALGVRQVVVVGQMPTWTLPLPRVLLRVWTRDGQVPERSLQSLDARVLRLDEQVRAAMADTQSDFISPVERLCNASGCLVSQTVNGVSLPLVHDQSHLTVAGSVAFVQRSRALLIQ